MLEQFRGFLSYSEEEFRELWEKAIFVVDTNVLINFYKYTSKESTKSLFDILKKLKENNRLWIPHQVALEYFFNYESNMYKQTEGYNLLGEELKTLQNNAVKIFSKVKSNHPYILTDKFQFFIDNLKTTNKKVEAELKKEIENLPDTNQIQQDILGLLNGIVGEVYPQQRIEEIQNEGKNRYEYKVPPGFKDKDDTNKKNYRTYGGIRYQQLYGDLLVWNQIIDKGKSDENSTPIIFITEEKKEDWWEKEGQNIKRPHPQLVQEFFNQTGENFYMYRTDNFVKFAKTYLNAELTDEQVENVTKELENIRKSEKKDEQNENPYVAKDILFDSWNGLSPVIMQYLDDEEQEMFQQELNKAFVIGIDSKQSDDKYYNAIHWGIIICLDRLEKRVEELTGKLAFIDYEKAQTALARINPLSNYPFERGLILLEHIKFLESEIFSLELSF
ncbi:PIN-like domain-containing protein [Priestia aryabhattai]|uniref:PIN-like domain-containing protein n=1 Tax=Priestia aryabhattai TaxID=412384 RepID=UPI003D2AFA63